MTLHTALTIAVQLASIVFGMWLGMALITGRW
jgi:hypothetical protein